MPHSNISNEKTEYANVEAQLELDPKFLASFFPSFTHHKMFTMEGMPMPMQWIFCKVLDYCLSGFH